MPFFPGDPANSCNDLSISSMIELPALVGNGQTHWVDQCSAHKKAEAKLTSSTMPISIKWAMHCLQSHSSIFVYIRNVLVIYIHRIPYTAYYSCHGHSMRLSATLSST